MLDRESCERRVYRLAVLLTGNPIGAAKVISQVLDAKPDLRLLDSAHMDRLTVLRSRESPAGMLADARIAAPLARWLAELDPQRREAWVLARVYRAPEREMARAMDCSLTAALRHLAQADRQLIETTGDADQAAAAVLAYSMAIDVPAFYRIERRRNRQWHIAMRVAAIALLAIALASIVLWWARPLSG